MVEERKKGWLVAIADLLLLYSNTIKMPSLSNYSMHLYFTFILLFTRIIFECNKNNKVLLFRSCMYYSSAGFD